MKLSRWSRRGGILLVKRTVPERMCDVSHQAREGHRWFRDAVGFYGVGEGGPG